MISGATGAMAVVMVHMIQQGNQVGESLANPINNLGLYWLFITLLFVGVIQMSAGVFKLGKICSPHSPPRHDGFCQWSCYRDFLIATSTFQNDHQRRNRLVKR